MTDTILLEQDEFWLSDLARQLGVPMPTLRKWRRAGWLHSRKVVMAGGRWAVWADADELSRLRRLRCCQRQWPELRYPPELTTPKPLANTE